MTISARTKRKPKPRMETCPDCVGRYESVAVTCVMRDGRELPGVESRRATCATCDSSGKVRARRANLRRGDADWCCCRGPAAERCQGCLEAFGPIHFCEVMSDEEIEDALRLVDLFQEGE